MKKVELYLSDEEWTFAEGLFQRLGYSYAVFEVENLSFSFSPSEEEVNAQAEAFEAEKAEKEHEARRTEKQAAWQRLRENLPKAEWEEHETVEFLLKDAKGEVEE
jgi:hypothetical protein